MCLGELVSVVCPSKILKYMLVGLVETKAEEHECGQKMGVRREDDGPEQPGMQNRRGADA